MKRDLAILIVAVLMAALAIGSVYSSRPADDSDECGKSTKLFCLHEGEE